MQDSNWAMTDRTHDIVYHDPLKATHRWVKLTVFVGSAACAGGANRFWNRRMLCDVCETHVQSQ